MRKPVFGVYDQVRLKPACKTTESGLSLQILHITTIGNKRITKVLMTWLIYSFIFIFYFQTKGNKVLFSVYETSRLSFMFLFTDAISKHSYGFSPEIRLFVSAE